MFVHEDDEECFGLLLSGSTHVLTTCIPQVRLGDTGY